jgi:hypothetical protein
MPCRWDAAGRVRFRRRFGYPGRIDAHERVWLTFAGVGGGAEVSLNGRPLGRRDGGGPFEFEVTPLLGPRNELVADVEATAGGGLWGEVALEVRRTAYLRHVRAFVEGGRLRVAGEVVGCSDRPLDLYLLLDGSTAAYVTVEPHPDGRPFGIGPEVAGASPRRVRVELIDGGSVWYAVEPEYAGFSPTS